LHISKIRRLIRLRVAFVDINYLNTTLS